MTSIQSELKTGHIGLNVSDVARSSEFYRRVLGLEILGESSEEGRQFVFLGAGETLMLTLWQQSAGRFSTAQPGLHHLSFQVENLDAVREVQARVRDLGAKFLYDDIVPHAEGAPSGGIFFEDPDGIRLEVFTPSGVGTTEAPSGEAPSCGFF